MSRKGKSIETESTMGVVWSWRWEGEGMRDLIRGMEIF